MWKASVRFDRGGSGRFVSAEGPNITNHRLGADALVKEMAPWVLAASEPT